EVVAMNAGVGEELDHLDLARRRLDRRGLGQALVFDALARGHALGQDRKGCARGQQGQGEIAAVHERTAPSVKLVDWAVAHWESSRADQRCTRTSAASTLLTCS